LSDTIPASPSSSSSSPPEDARERASKGTIGREVRQERRNGFRRAALALLYVCFLVAVTLGCLAGLEYYARLQVAASPLGQAYKGKDLDKARLSSQTVAPQYGYEPTPGFAAIRNTKLGNAYEYINDESFKDFEDVPLEKPADEYRVFVTGGSVVFGRGPVPPADEVTDHYEVTYRWNIPHIMEQLLNADPRVREKTGGRKVRVINAGVAGYVIQNSMMRYLAKLRLYKPDLLVALDGANEVHTVARPLRDWNYFTEGPYYEVIIDTMDMSRKGLANYLSLWLKRNTYFFTWLALRRGEGTGILMENRGFAAHPQDATAEMIAFRDRNIRQVADVEAIFHSILQTDGVPHVFALQPMFRNSKKKRTPIEEKIEQITGMEKIGFYGAAETYDALVRTIKARCREAGVEVADLTGIFDGTTAWVFTDWCHLTNGANYILAKELANRVKKEVLSLSPLPDDPLKTPFDSYFEDLAKTAKVVVDGKTSDEGVHILKGYPGPQTFEVPASPGRVPQLVLDLGAPTPFSRFRIVWADSKSVPSAWKVEHSMDGKTWNTWLEARDAKPDGYDQWPGFEHYAPEETQARYVRYSATGPDTAKPIQLRQLSLYR
jgi:hypothetical protein